MQAQRVFHTALLQQRTTMTETHKIPTIPNPPRGRRWLSATIETWEGWWSSGRGVNDHAAAFRTLILADDFHRAEDPLLRSQLASELDKSQRRLLKGGLTKEAKKAVAPTEAEWKAKSRARGDRWFAEHGTETQESVRALYRNLEDDGYTQSHVTQPV